MAAYAALMFLTHVMDQIKNHHRPPISLDKHQVESLTQKVTFLLEFLEGSNVSSNKEANALKSRITDAACAAEDVIETHIVDKILGGSSSHDGEEMNSLNLLRDLQKVMEDMDSIKKEVMEVQDLLKKNMPKTLGSLGSSTGQNNTMVGFKDVLIEIMDKLTGGRLDRQIIPIVGMGGIRKTTLARNVYASKLIKDYFDVCAWTPISQEYNTQEILCQILSQDSKERKDKLSKLNENELGEALHKSLWGRRYLIVLDDIWSIEVWDKISLFFPDNNNGSSIIITTRLSHLAYQITGFRDINLALLDEGNSWSLFSKLVFGIRANRESDFPSSVYLRWNLQTIIVDPQFMKTFTAPLHIWNMPQLRHVEFPVGLNLPDVEVGLVMKNLQTLKNVANFKCSEEVVKRIPNIKKLGVEYRNQEGVPLKFHRDNLHRLHQLESFQCSFTHYAPDSLHQLTFPLSLKKLTLEIRPLNHWDDHDVLEKVGSLSSVWCMDHSLQERGKQLNVISPASKF